jgi:hypothetical protein
MQARISDLASAVQTMASNAASKADIADIRSDMTQFVTRAEVEAKLQMLAQEVERNKPSTMLRNFAAILAGIAALGAVVAMVLAVSEFINRVPPKQPYYYPAPEGVAK